MNPTSTSPRRRFSTAALRRAATSLAVIALTLMGCVGITAAPANANRQPLETSDCSRTLHWTQATATKVTIRVTMTCDPIVLGMRHDLTVQRSGKVIATPSKQCYNKDAVRHFRCTIRRSYSDPSGSQTWAVLDEWTVQAGIFGSLPKGTMTGDRTWSFTT